MCCKYKNFQVLELRTTGGVVNLPLSTALERRTITSIAVRRPSANRKSATGAPIATQEVVDTAHLKMVTADGDHIAQIPLNLLERDYLNAEPLSVEWQNISTTASYITLDTGATGYNSTHVIELILGYDGPVCRV